MSWYFFSYNAICHLVSSLTASFLRLTYKEARQVPEKERALPNAAASSIVKSVRAAGAGETVALEQFSFLTAKTILPFSLWVHGFKLFLFRDNHILTCCC